jgi:hypothetical protein
MAGKKIQNQEVAVMSLDSIIRLSNNNLDDFIDSLTHPLSLERFDDKTVEFLHAFSSIILKNKKYRKYPESIVLADWFRKRNITKLINSEACTNKYPLGLVFHIAPGNVDTIFLYSLFISLLNGNKNVVKISNRESELILFMVDDLFCLLDEPKFVAIKNYINIIQYDNEKLITEKISSACNCRIIWGGDDTVNKISSLFLNPTAREIKFPNRFSFTVIDCNYLKNQDKTSFQHELAMFFKDLSTFSQQACSSPKKIFWLNHDDAIINKWWSELEKMFDDYDQSLITDQFVNLNLISANISGSANFAKVSRFGINKLNQAESKFLRANHFGNLLCIEQNLSSIEELTDYVCDNDQTVSLIGSDQESIIRVISKTTAIDRVVKNGNALNFSHIWDGFNMFDITSRFIGTD